MIIYILNLYGEFTKTTQINTCLLNIFVSNLVMPCRWNETAVVKQIKSDRKYLRNSKLDKLFNL